MKKNEILNYGVEEMGSYELKNVNGGLLGAIAGVMVVFWCVYALFSYAHEKITK